MQCLVEQPQWWWVWGLGLGTIVLCNLVAIPMGLAIHLLRSNRLLLAPLVLGVVAVPPFVLPRIYALLGGDVEQPGAIIPLFYGASVFSWAVFRAIEAAIGTTPRGALTNYAEWNLYFTASIDPRYGPEDKPIVPPPGAVAAKIGLMLTRLVILGTLSSVMRPYDFRPLTAQVCPGYQVSFFPEATRCFNAYMFDNFLGGLVIWLFLAFSFDMGSVLLLLQNHEPIEAFHNPLFASTSPREFWGKRWNIQVNQMLKRVVFKPMMDAKFGGAVAAIATFGASALFHEYQFILSFKTYKFGLILAFFFGQGAVTAIQNIVQNAAKQVPALYNGYGALPHPVRVALNLAVLMPFGTPFMNTWINFGMFDAISRCTFTIVCN